MSTYTIEINDEILNKQIQDILNNELNWELRRKYGDTGREISAAVKELVYSRKDEIIEMVIDKAAREIVKKGLPKLIERFDK